jgi:hypothetical protein
MAKDLTLDEDDDLLISQGDLVVSDSLQQEVDLILRTSQGEWRDSPLTGFGVARRMRGQVKRPEFERALATQLELDGMQGTAVELSPDGQLSIDAHRNE